MDFEDNIVKLLNDEFAKRIYLNGKYTEVQFAKDIGINKDSMHAYLNKKRVPNADSLVKISKGLNISVDYLLGLTNIKNIEPVDDEKAIARVSELSGLKKETINYLISCNYESKEIINEYNLKFENDKLTGLPIYSCLYNDEKLCMNEDVYDLIEHLSTIEFINLLANNEYDRDAEFSYLYDYLVIGNDYSSDYNKDYKKFGTYINKEDLKSITLKRIEMKLNCIIDSLAERKHLNNHG